MKKQFSRTRSVSVLSRYVRPLPLCITFVIGALVVLRLAAPGVFLTLSKPLWQAGTSVSARLNTLTSGFQRTSTLAREVETLSEQNTALTIEHTKLAARAADLEKLLGTRTAPPIALLGSVLARPPLAPYDTLVLDIGSAQGVVQNALVLGSGGVPLGKINQVSTHTSRVLLYSAAGQDTAAWVGDARVPVSLLGTSGATFSTDVPKDTKIQEGDAVYVGGDGALPLGTVFQVHTDPSSAKAHLFIRGALNPFSLVWVTVARSAP